MAKKKVVNPALDLYKFTGEHAAGIDHGVEYNIETVTVELIEVMIERGSDNWEKKPKKETKE